MEEQRNKWHRKINDGRVKAERAKAEPNGAQADPKRSRSGSKPEPKRHESGLEGGGKAEPKWIRSGAKAEPNRTEAERKRNGNDPKAEEKQSQSKAKAEPKRMHSGTKAERLRNETKRKRFLGWRLLQFFLCWLMASSLSALLAPSAGLLTKIPKTLPAAMAVAPLQSMRCMRSRKKNQRAQK